jgi:osmotically-inducible protein OsmY
MNIKESTDTKEGSIRMEENCLHSSENIGYYDSQIKISILVSLAWYSDIPADEICITVNHGFVNIYGLVPWMHQKLMITAAIRKTKGVRGLTNNIFVVNQFLQAAI